MNRTILSQIKRAIRLNLEDKAGQLIESHGAYLSKRNYRSLIRYITKHEKYPYKVIAYVYYRSAYRWHDTATDILKRAIYTTIIENDPNSLRELLKNKHNDLNIDAYGNNIMETAVRNARSSADIVRMLLADERIDPCADNNIALRAACWHGRTEIVRILLKDGRADPRSLDDYAIRTASSGGHIEIVRLLLEDGRANPGLANYEVLFLAASQAGQIEIVRLLLEDDRVIPNAMDGRVIRGASEKGYIGIVRLLLKDGRSDPSFNNSDALRVASANGHIEVVKLLLADGRSDPSADGNRALHESIKYNRIEVVQLLLTDSRVMNVGLNRAIAVANMFGRTQIADLLIKVKNDQV
jgi:ankyrin repeat protein